MCNVLVIDDEHMICDLLKQALSRIDFNVDTANNAKGGIAKFDKGHYDLVITDMRMPGVDGRSIVHYIRNSSRNATPVIGLSGTPWLLHNGGFDDVLFKPFPLQRLLEKVTALTKMPLAG